MELGLWIAIVGTTSQIYRLLGLQPVLYPHLGFWGWKLTQKQDGVANGCQSIILYQGIGKYGVGGQSQWGFWTSRQVMWGAIKKN